MKGTGLDQITEKPSKLLWWKHKNTGMITGKGGWLRVLLMKTQCWTTPTEGSYKVNFDEALFGNLGKIEGRSKRLIGEGTDCNAKLGAHG